MERVKKYFDENEFVYRRSLTIKSIADEIIGDALETLNIKDNVPYGLVCDHIDIAVKDFMKKLENAVGCMLEEYAISNNKTETRYQHLGYYNEVGDIMELGGESADEVLDYYKNGYGAFYEDYDSDPDTDLIKEEELKTKDVFFTEDGKFAIVTGWYEGWNEEHKDSEDGDDSDVYIDIYQLKD